MGALLAAAGERAPADALNLDATAAGAGICSQVALSGIWMLPADMAPARSHVVLRAIDSNGRPHRGGTGPLRMVRRRFVAGLTVLADHGRGSDARWLAA
jgi:hypothetical protein